MGRDNGAYLSDADGPPALLGGYLFYHQSTTETIPISKQLAIAHY